MELDEELCLCFHVTKRKVVNYLRIEKPKRAGQLSECFGAGTGCGWCRPFLLRLFEQAQGDPESLSLPTKKEYEAARAKYIRKKKEADSETEPTGDGSPEAEDRSS